MNICRFGADVSAIGTNLVICGGSDDASRLSTAERYEPQNNVWVPITPMSSKRNGVGVTTCGGKIYAIGMDIYVEMTYLCQMSKLLPSRHSPAHLVLVFLLLTFSR